MVSPITFVKYPTAKARWQVERYLRARSDSAFGQVRGWAPQIPEVRPRPLASSADQAPDMASERWSQVELRQCLGGVKRGTKARFAVLGFQSWAGFRAGKHDVERVHIGVIVGFEDECDAARCHEKAGLLLDLATRATRG